VVSRGDRLFQRRFELTSQGTQTNVYEMEATHAVGSGNHARTWLHRSDAGEFTELPLTWYSQEKRWAMSPGFDNPAPQDFTRIVDDRCLFCHNGYPSEAGKLAEGIDCQRCHGPGSRHIEIASAGRAARSDIAAAIVNPRKLSAERQFDVCLQCHLETTSAPLPAIMLRFDREMNSFRPGEALSAYAVQFDDVSSANRFEIVNQGYRLRQSACFRESQGRLTCLTCHDPHQHQTSAARYRSQCVSCHSSVASAGHPDLQTSDCISCHMLKRRAQDVDHVVMTDHRIERKPANLPKTPAASGRPTLYFPAQLPEPDAGLYLGAALIVGGADRRDGIAKMQKSLNPNSPAKATAVLGEGYFAEGNSDRAIELFQQSLAKNPAAPKVRYNLGEALAQAGRSGEARVEYEQALRLRGAFPEAEYALANALIKTGDTASAIAHFQKAILLRPNYAEAHNNLGNLRANGGAFDEALRELTVAVQINPALTDAHINLARVLSAQHQLPAAIEEIRKAVSLNGRHAVARYNLAMLLQQTGSSLPAIAEYRRAVDIDPDFVEAHLRLAQALGDAGQLDASISEFREVLRRRPADLAATQGLEMATGMKRGVR
ncbi:MAG: tetratricopeptide repeat protein, partial [Bryobacterales bacterium]|nr:tetratricopeptide repeat protein [Bryobacterales bacterium]